MKKKYLVDSFAALMPPYYILKHVCYLLKFMKLTVLNCPHLKLNPCTLPQPPPYSTMPLPPPPPQIPQMESHLLCTACSESSPSKYSPHPAPTPPPSYPPPKYLKWKSTMYLLKLCICTQVCSISPHSLRLAVGPESSKKIPIICLNPP